MDVAVEHALIPETIARFAILGKIVDFGYMADLAFAAQGAQGTSVRMHGGEDESHIGDGALNVAWAVIPIDPQRFDRAGGFCFGGKKLHDARQIIRLPGRFTDEINMVFFFYLLEIHTDV